ncbi:hypothetical protein [Weissella sp. MSCH1]|uniref:hypothetical protein n=1 Tax=Weissella sp. MSCH1 TaxID=3383343 RepID=UPI003896D6D9
MLPDKSKEILLDMIEVTNPKLIVGAGIPIFQYLEKTNYSKQEVAQASADLINNHYVTRGYGSNVIVELLLTQLALDLL